MQKHFPKFYQKQVAMNEEEYKGDELSNLDDFQVNDFESKTSSFEPKSGKLVSTSSNESNNKSLFQAQ